MCGIAAIIATSKNAPPVDRAVLDRMAGSLAGRGPDATGIWISPDGRVGLLNRRLSTQDARPLANQPCYSSDRAVVAVMNGEIYNHRALRVELEARGCAFATNNDTEVLANAYRAWGRDMLPRLQGQFAFACYDTQTGQALAARDCHGICPLYYMERDGLLVLASTPGALFDQPGLPRSLDPQAVTDFFIQDSTGWERTFFAGVRHLRAGYSLACAPGGPARRERFYQVGLDYFAPDESRSEGEWVEAIRATLDAAIRQCMLGDKEVGIYLSGGIDSMSVLALLKRIFPDLSIQTFSAGFADVLTGESIGEADFAAKMARHFCTVHHEVIVTPEEIVAGVGTFDLPPSSVIDTVIRRLAQTAAGAGVNVALSGEGSDEMFFGYDHYMAAAGFLNPEFSWLSERYYLRGEYAKSLDPARSGLTDLFLGGGANIDWDNSRSQVFGPGAEGTRPVRDYIRELAAETALNGRGPAGLDRQLIYIDYAQKVPENLLRRAEGPSMGSGVEMRFPFLWDDLVRLMYHMPMAMRIGDGSTKYMLRKVMAGVLPEEALNRPKSPFGLPAARREHFKGSGLDFRRPAFKNLFNKHFARVEAAVMDGAYTRERLFDPGFVSRMVEAQRDCEACSFNNFLWKLWNFAEWYERQIA